MIAVCDFHRPGDKPDILILSSARSGSTWLMELLAAEPGMKNFVEPLMKSRLDDYGINGLRARWRYASLNPSEQRIFKDYFQEHRDIKAFGSLKFFHPDFNFFSDRRVIKVIRATPLAEWFATQTSLQVIHLVRHPISQSLSCIQRHHDHHLGEYLSDETFVGEHLNDDLASFVERVIQDGPDLDRFVTAWCLDNLVPLRATQDTPRANDDAPWLTVTYEEMVLETESLIGLLADRFDLSQPDRLIKKVKQPSKVTDSSSAQTVDKIRQGDRRFLIEKWMSKVTADQKQRVGQILDRFGIDAYHPDRGLPSDRLLHRQSRDNTS